MDCKRLVDLRYKSTCFSGWFSAYGSFGIVDGRSRELACNEEIEEGYIAKHEKFSAVCEYDAFENDVYRRRDTFINTSDGDITLQHFASRFLLEGGEYEVYSQFNAWQRECEGGWQPLTTGVELEGGGIRSTETASPFVVVRNKGNGKMFVFHLVPNGHWFIRVRKSNMFSKFDAVVVETGLCSRGMNLVCHPGEIIEMPQVFLFEAENTIDFDAWKLHTVYNRLYPRKVLPVVYNTWMLQYDHINIAEIMRQVDCAANLGVEIFVLDAGWFGEGKSWESNIGHWVENQDGAFCGKLSEVSAYIRSKNMKFGLWLEPERALAGVPMVEEHPEYYKEGSNGHFFLDFGHEAARSYIYQVTCELVEKYSISYLKFDFNIHLGYDEAGESFYRYFIGQRQYINDLRKKYPDLYITNCAGGGSRMDLGQQMLFDSIWPTDNHNCYTDTRIFKETVKRMPPSNIEKWGVYAFRDGFPNYVDESTKELMLNCDGGTWDSVVAMQPSFLHGYLKGGVVGLSGNIANHPAKEQEELKTIIAHHKENRPFFRDAILHILHDTEKILAIQYSDIEYKRNFIQIFCLQAHQHQLTVYPRVNRDAIYEYNGTNLTGAEILNKGLIISLQEKSCIEFELKEQ